MRFHYSLPALYKRHTNDRVPFTRYPHTSSVRGRYVGVRKRLSGKIALLQIPTFSSTPVNGLRMQPFVMAQFNDLTQPEAHGWAVFATSDFEPVHD